MLNQKGDEIMSKHYLYIKTDPLHYQLAGEFDSFEAAASAKNSTYADKKFKILSEQAALAEGQKQLKRAEKVEKVEKALVSGAKTFGRGAVTVGKTVGRATGQAIKRGAERAAELHEQKLTAEREYERELLPMKREQEKLAYAQRAEESRQRGALEFEREQQMRKIHYKAQLKAERERANRPKPSIANVEQRNREFFEREQGTERPIKQYQPGPGYVPAPFQQEQGYGFGQPGEFHIPQFHAPMYSSQPRAPPQPVMQRAPVRHRKKKGVKKK